MDYDRSLRKDPKTREPLHFGEITLAAAPGAHVYESNDEFWASIGHTLELAPALDVYERRPLRRRDATTSPNQPPRDSTHNMT